MLKALKASGSVISLRSDGDEEEEEFDLLIVGGGATGAGCAVDAASRGLKVALVERDDFGAGKWRGKKNNNRPLPSDWRLVKFFFSKRYFFQIDKTRSWWRSISAKGCLRA